LPWFSISIVSSKPRTRSAAHHRQVRVDVDRPGRHRLEELHLEVGLLVDGQRLGPDAADGEDPAGEEARVLQEQP
jgi:hypothetical protein